MGAPQHFDAVVVGSGFGGAVTAARLAQAGLSVAVLERGRRWEPGSFPRDDSSFDHGWLWSKSRGLYDVRWLGKMIGVQAAGWGGGSLVYANVFARPPHEVFDAWPAGFDRAALDPYYDLVAHMLGVSPVGTDPVTGDVPARTIAMEQAASRMHRPTGTVRPLLAVTFAQDGAAPTAGTCTFVGECMFGCNQGAKNSVDRNYLGVAERSGATAFTLTEVDRIEPTGTGYRVHATDLAAGEHSVITADNVFLAAGAVATTELLLRNRDLHQSLPALSATLGHGFSGNGDFLAFVSRPRTQLQPGRGPTITTTTIVDCHIGDEKVWFQVQDGAYPEQIRNLVRSLNPLGQRRSVLRQLVERIGGTGRGPAARPGRRRDQTMSLLMMGRDSSDGVLSLKNNGEAALEWRNRPNAALYRTQMRAARQTARQLGGRVRVLPSWMFLRTGITVHNLGGVPMGTTASTGVVDHHGRVHGYPGLYVVDGSAVPAATGVNPSATIAAVAERAVEAAIRDITADPEWTAPERSEVRPTVVPEDAAMVAVQRWRDVREPGREARPLPVHFREVVTGDATMTAPDGSTSTQRLRLGLEVEVPDTATPAGVPAPPARVTGVAVFGATRVQVRGTLELFPDERGTLMQYRLRYTDGRACWGSLTGAKTHVPGTRPTIGDLTRLPVVIDHHKDGMALTGGGTVRISSSALTQLLLSVRGAGGSWLASAATVLRFGRYFATSALRSGR
ncbi:GMC oxidoreductase [Curtobacterium sp. ISL-83]|uniref:GMC oxidoreductase n=1 Tax=Curtobacterium sp. ISL-83 TaxID=2819145 RepID=UPI001BE56CE3|nr:GMC family oxidoreductase [Curtobacterium sp. ISL-83]MBT2502408.1 GMC family oxidoreductase [Curtobacterium sp. ISL-83]